MAQDSFTILELISQSPTTSVYRAHQNVLDRAILLKVLHKHLVRDRDLVARFSREAKACAILKSENIVQVFDLTEVDGAPAIVMEFIDGKSLADLLEDKSARSEELLNKVAVSVLKALAYAHDRGVTHRDIKPGNILISQDGAVKVTDFGLAAVSDAPSLTMEGSLIGTPAYMSPEQARGEIVDQRTDLFSLGVTLVEILTGEKILAGRSYAECISRIQSFNTGMISHVASHCSPNTFEFLKKLLAPNKYDRFASAGEALSFFERGPSVTTPAVDAPGNTPARSRRGSLVFAAGAVVVILIGLSFVFRHPTGKNASAVIDTIAATGKTAVRPGETKSSEKHDGVAPPKNEGKTLPRATGENIFPPPSGTAKDSSYKPAVLADNAAAKDSGYMNVQCKPWAKIFVDNEYAGTTPISGSIKIPVGEHTVTFSNPNFVPIVKQVGVKTDSLSSVSADFIKNSGYLIVSVEPWGKVYVDDQLRETTPSAQPIIVSAGTRRIRIHNPAFQDIVKTLTVNPGDTLRLNFNFSSKDSL